MYQKTKRQDYEAEYAINNESCVILEVQTPNGWQCFDATRRFGTLRHLMNHALPGKASLKLFRPLLVHGKWRVGFQSTRDLELGKVLTWNYGCPPEGQQ